MIRDILEVNAPNGVLIATFSIADVQAMATLILTVVSIICTVAITIYKIRCNRD